MFYDVTDTAVYVMRVLAKAAVAEYLKEMGYEIEDDQRGRAGAGDGPDRE